MMGLSIGLGRALFWSFGVGLLFAPISAGAEPPATWSVYHGGPENSKYSPLDQINRDNVKSLAVAWVYDSGDAFNDGGRMSELQSNPIIVGNRLYTVTPKARVVALDAATGREVWSYDPLPDRKVKTTIRLRGVTHWSDGKDSRILFTVRHHLYALDAVTGRPVTDFGDNGRVDLRQGFDRDVANIMIGGSTPGIVHKDLLILGSTGFAPGDIRAFDIRTGKIRWTFHTIPRPGEYGYDTWPDGAWKYMNGANNWAGMALDEKRGIVYVPTASGGGFEKDFYGADRIGDNLFANSLIALDANTGKRLWHFQTVRHDLWDRDLPAQPSLVTVVRDGRTIDAVAQVTKSGFVFVFDRVTGEPLFPIEDRAVPPSDVPGEKAALTQPFPVKPAPFVPQDLTADQLTQRTPAAHAAVLEQFRKLRNRGAFDPPSVEGTIIFPGLDGGAEWGGSAFDPKTGLLYINANIMPWILKLKEKPKQSDAVDGKSLYANYCASCHGENRRGSPPEFPSLVNINRHLTVHDTLALVSSGVGRMPSFGWLPREQIYAIADYVINDRNVAVTGAAAKAPEVFWTDNYIFEGYTKFLDPDGYPAVQPPWGTLSAINLNTGDYAWQIPLGEYPELVAKGQRNTGSENYGGPVVTAGGLVFIGATVHDRKFRAFDKLTGALLWETTLPTSANATPAIYAVDGRQFIVIAAGGGKSDKAPADGKFIAFALPER